MLDTIENAGTVGDLNWIYYVHNEEEQFAAFSKTINGKRIVRVFDDFKFKPTSFKIEGKPPFTFQKKSENRPSIRINVEPL